jgi:subtilisin-like proprotein convertase family protein
MHLARASVGRRNIAALAVLSLLLALPVIALAKTAPVAAAGKRVIQETPWPATRALMSEVAGAWLSSSDESGVVRRMTRVSPSPAARSPFDAEATARAFLIERSGAMDLSSDLSELRTEAVIESPGGYHVRYQQMYDGIPVEAGVVWVTVSRSGEVVRVVNEAAQHPAVDVRPNITADEAIASVRRTIGASGSLHAPERADLVVRAADGSAFLAWKTLVPADEPFGDWEAFVDARSGAVRELRNRVQNFVDGSGQTWDPNPPVALQDNTIADLSDADQAAFNPSYLTVTLHELDDAVGGLYRLRGRFASSIEFESPVVTLATDASASGFVYTRANDMFEEVLCYYHIDATERLIQSLGFTNVNNRIQEFDAHGLNGDDNSHYIPSSKRIAYGDGCVDDSEDADVVIHEYGHSIQDNQVPGWGASAEGGAMGEGFGDFIASVMASDVNPTFQPFVVFDWDKGPVDNCWPGRRLDTTRHYPEDLVGQVHTDGEIWSAVCWQIANDIGMQTALAVVLEAQFDVPTTGNMVDCAEAMVVADQSLFGGAHVSSIVYWMDLRGILNASNYIPSITHTALGDTEDTVGPYLVTALVFAGAAPLNTGAIFTSYRVDAGSWTNAAMLATGNPNEFGASIPGQPDGSIVDYYVSAADSSGGVATHPVGAPGNFHTFRIGADTEAPVIVHTPLANQPLLTWPARVRALVTDNLGVASVTVEWNRNATPEASFALTREGATDYFSAYFPGVVPPVAIGDQVCYKIRAVDNSSNSNETLHPATGEHCFDVIDVLGSVLVINDWDGAKTSEPKVIEEKGVIVGVESGEMSKVASAASIARWLRDAGYAVTEETSAASDPGTWAAYSFIISSSGDDTSPVANAAYRAALEAYVAAGGKLLIEGGEVGYDAVSSPGYPTFKTNVLHLVSWNSDNAGALVRRTGFECHPLATTPHALPATLGITYGSYGDHDADVVAADATAIYGTTNYPNSSGIHFYDNNASPASAQIVDFNFSLEAMTDTTTAMQLLANAAAFLMVDDVGITPGTISGHVDLTDTSDDSGVIVTAGGHADTTDVSGYYQLTGLSPFRYTVQATKLNYTSGTQTCVAVLTGQDTPNIDFSLSPFTQVQVTYCVNPALAIPDNNSTGVTSIINVPDTGSIMNVLASVNITHTYKGDLEVALTSPANTTVMLHNNTGGSADNIITTYDTPTAVDGPGTMNDFDTQAPAGQWTLLVRDLVSVDTGTLNQWCVILTIAQPIVGVEENVPVPPATMLFAPRPNPFNPMTTVRYDVSAPGRVLLAVYDASGRLVRKLQDGFLPAGRYQALWDGMNDAGSRVGSGVYFARLQTGSRSFGSKMVVLK